MAEVTSTASHSSPSTARGIPGRRVVWGVGLAGVLVLAVGVALWARSMRWGPPSLATVESLLASKRYRAAASEAEALLAEKPDDPRVLYALGQARVGALDLAGGVAALEQIPEWSIRRAAALYFAGKATRDQNKGREAERLFLACIRRDPDGAPAMQARMELLSLYAMEERLDAFRSLVWDMIPRLAGGDRLVVLTMRMRIEFEQSKPELNARTTKALLDADPSDYNARAGLAAAHDRLLDLATARQLYEQALAEAPGEDVELHDRYLDLVLRMDGPPGLVRAIRAASAHPHIPHVASGDSDSTKEFPNPVVSRSSDRPGHLRLLGIVALAGSDLPTAKTCFAEAVAADPHDPEYRHRLAQVLYQQGKKSDGDIQSAAKTRLSRARDELRTAWNAFATAYEAEPSKVDPKLLLAMARGCAASGLTREAVAWYQETLRLDPAEAAAVSGLERIQNSIP